MLPAPLDDYGHLALQRPAGLVFTQPTADHLFKRFRHLPAHRESPATKNLGSHIQGLGYPVRGFKEYQSHSRVAQRLQSRPQATWTTGWIPQKDVLLGIEAAQRKRSRHCAGPRDALDSQSSLDCSLNQVGPRVADTRHSRIGDESNGFPLDCPLHHPADRRRPSMLVETDETLLRYANRGQKARRDTRVLCGHEVGDG